MTQRMFRKKYSELRESFLSMAAQGANGQEISSTLRIDARQAEAIHFDLLKSGKLEHTVRLAFAKRDEFAVAEKGNIFITADKIAALGVADIFAPETSLVMEWSGEGLLIKVRSQKSFESEVSQEKRQESTKRVSRWRTRFGRTSREQVSQPQDN